MVSFKGEKKEVRPLGTDCLLWALYQLIHCLLRRSEPLHREPHGARGEAGLKLSVASMEADTASDELAYAL